MIGNNYSLFFYFSFYKSNKEKIKNIKQAFKYGPATTPAKRNSLQGGAHIMFNRYIYTHHAIVTAVDKNTVNIIHFTGRNKKRAKIIKENIFTKIDKKCKVVSKNIEDCLISNVPEFKRLPFELSIAVAQYFENDVDSFGKYNVLKNNCEHFAFFCSFGYRVSFQQMKIFLIAYCAFYDLKTMDGGFDVIMKEVLLSKKAVEYKEGDKRVAILRLSYSKSVSISF